MTAAICRDLNKLVPVFRDRVLLLLERMREAGYDVQVWETYRSPERVKKLAARGTGSATSVHPYGVAVDIVERDKTPWVENKPGLWHALGQNARALGLVWGGDFVRNDRPHVQALTPRYDLLVAKVPEAERNLWVGMHMRPMPPQPPRKTAQPTPKPPDGA